MSHHYDEFAWHFRRLARAYDDGQMVLVLGAGVSIPYGQPGWPQLLTRLLIESGRVPRLGRKLGSPASKHDIEKAEHAAIAAILGRLAPDPLMQGALAHEAYPHVRWNEAIDRQLGSGTARHVPSLDDTGGVLRTIAQMLVRSIRKNPKFHLSVLSFNYDSLLDIAIAEELEASQLRKTVLRSIRSAEDFERTWVDAGIHIYHLHGYLDDPNPDPVLDAASYVPVFRGDHWSWRCMERALIGTGTASLFIGLSLADPSLRYLLFKWQTWQTPMTGMYLASPPYLDAVDWKDQRSIARMYRAIMDLYSAVLDHLHLVCYHLSSLREIGAILNSVAGTA